MCPEEELRGRKLKVMGNKVDLIARLKAALILEDQHEENDDDEYNDESEDERNEADDVRVTRRAADQNSCRLSRRRRIYRHV